MNHTDDVLLHTIGTPSAGPCCSSYCEDL